MRKTGIMRRTAVLWGVLAALGVPPGPAGAQNDPGRIHPRDYRTCKTCGAALEKAMGYLKKNLEKTIAGYWYAEFLNSYYGGLAFLMDGNSQKEAKMCADKIAKYFDPWVRSEEAASVREAASHVHGSRPQKRKRAYGLAPGERFGRRNWKTSV